MEYHLDHKVILGTEPEHKNLYSWFLSEIGDKVSKYARDQIPWQWTQYFTLSEIKLTSGTEFEDEHDNDGSKITETESIVARLTPGHIMDGRFHRDTTYSMFGTDRRISEFSLQISRTTDEEKQGCSAWGCVSYTSEIDFRTDTQPDMIYFYLKVNAERFDRYVQRIREKSITSALFRIGRVAGFYSDWSPSISTSNIKVLTNSRKDHPVEIAEGCEITPPRLGPVGEAELFLYSEQTFNLPSIEDFDDDSENDIQHVPLRTIPSDVRSNKQITDAKVIATLKSLRFAAWLIAGLLFLILLK